MKYYKAVDLLYFKLGADVGIDTIIMPSIVDFGIDQVGETWCSINDNLLLLGPHCIIDGRNFSNIPCAFDMWCSFVF